MNCKIILTAQPGVDSKAEIEEELQIIEDITGVISHRFEKNSAVYELEFHEFYLKVKERIMRKLKAYD